MLTLCTLRFRFFLFVLSNIEQLSSIHVLLAISMHFIMSVLPSVPWMEAEASPSPRRGWNTSLWAPWNIDVCMWDVRHVCAKLEDVSLGVMKVWGNVQLADSDDYQDGLEATEPPHTLSIRKKLIFCILIIIRYHDLQDSLKNSQCLFRHTNADETDHKMKRRIYPKPTPPDSTFTKHPIMMKDNTRSHRNCNWIYAANFS